MDCNWGIARMAAVDSTEPRTVSAFARRDHPNLSNSLCVDTDVCNVALEIAPHSPTQLTIDNDPDTLEHQHQHELSPRCSETNRAHLL
jgi:hypothetical protein